MSGLSRVPSHVPSQGDSAQPASSPPVASPTTGASVETPLPLRTETGQPRRVSRPPSPTAATSQTKTAEVSQRRLSLSQETPQMTRATSQDKRSIQRENTSATTPKKISDVAKARLAGALESLKQASKTEDKAGSYEAQMNKFNKELTQLSQEMQGISRDQQAINQLNQEASKIDSEADKLERVSTFDRSASSIAEIAEKRQLAQAMRNEILPIKDKITSTLIEYKALEKTISEYKNLFYEHLNTELSSSLENLNPADKNKKIQDFFKSLGKEKTLELIKYAVAKEKEALEQALFKDIPIATDMRAHLTNQQGLNTSMLDNLTAIGISDREGASLRLVNNDSKALIQTMDCLNEISTGKKEGIKLYDSLLSKLNSPDMKDASQSVRERCFATLLKKLGSEERQADFIIYAIKEDAKAAKTDDFLRKKEVGVSLYKSFLQAKVQGDIVQVLQPIIDKVKGANVSQTNELAIKYLDHFSTLIKKVYENPSTAAILQRIHEEILPEIANCHEKSPSMDQKKNSFSPDWMAFKFIPSLLVLRLATPVITDHVESIGLSQSEKSKLLSFAGAVQKRANLAVTDETQLKAATEQVKALFTVATGKKEIPQKEDSLLKLRKADGTECSKEEIAILKEIRSACRKSPPDFTKLDAYPVKSPEIHMYMKLMLEDFNTVKNFLGEAKAEEMKLQRIIMCVREKEGGRDVTYENKKELQSIIETITKEYTPSAIAELVDKNKEILIKGEFTTTSTDDIKRIFGALPPKLSRTPSPIAPKPTEAPLKQEVVKPPIKLSEAAQKIMDEPDDNTPDAANSRKLKDILSEEEP